jgi:chorismate-pyruvate lyase
VSAQVLMTLLTEHDGSTTRLCEALAGAPVEVRVLSQRVSGDVPSQVRTLLPGDLFIERITSLIANDAVMTDNLVYIALEGLDAQLQERLRIGSLPIGSLMAGRWLRRDALCVDDEVLERLWRAVGHADPDAMRCYRLLSHEGPAMLICETFRHGILSARAQP